MEGITIYDLNSLLVLEYELFNAEILSDHMDEALDADPKNVYTEDDLQTFATKQIVKYITTHFDNVLVTTDNKLYGVRDKYPSLLLESRGLYKEAYFLGKPSDFKPGQSN